MITVRKLSGLPGKTGLRKAARLLQGFEMDFRTGIYPNPVYLRDLFEYIKNSSELSEDRNLLVKKIVWAYTQEKESLVRTCNRIRHILLTQLNEAPGDWDLLEENSVSDLKGKMRKVLPLEVFMDDIRSPFNVGSIFRTSESFAISKIFLSPETASPLHRRARRTAMGCTDIVPWETLECNKIIDKKIFALELNGTPLDQFEFPDSGIVIIGSEELGVSPECLEAADRSAGRVSIPITGIKGSINVSVAFGILMYNWLNHVMARKT